MEMVSNALRTLADFCFKSGDLPTYAQKLSMYAGLFLLKRLSFVVQTNSTNIWSIQKLNRPDVCCQCMRVQKLLLSIYARTQRLL